MESSADQRSELGTERVSVGKQPNSFSRVAHQLNGRRKVSVAGDEDGVGDRFFRKSDAFGGKESDANVDTGLDGKVHAKHASVRGAGDFSTHLFVTKLGALIAQVLERRDSSAIPGVDRLRRRVHPKLV